MKIAILGDTHFAQRNGNPVFYEYFRKFYKFFFQKLDSAGVNVIIQLGDLTDKRKSIDFLSFYEMQKMFIDPIVSRGIQTYVISGNHDCYYKSNNSINSVDLILNSKPNFTVIDNHPCTYDIGGLKFDFFPWINDENYNESINYAAITNSEFAVGHFEFANFRLSKNQIAKTGLSHKLFSNYRLAMSGHYHTMSRIDNILYTGTPYELDWNDWNDQKGFFILDTETLDLEHVINPYTLHEKIIYSETDTPSVDHCTDKYIKLILPSGYNQYKLDTFIKRLNETDPYDIKIIEEDVIKSIDESLSINREYHTTQEMISIVIDSMDIDLDKNRLKSMINDTYITAIELSKQL